MKGTIKKANEINIIWLGDLPEVVIVDDDDNDDDDVEPRPLTKIQFLYFNCKHFKQSHFDFWYELL